jgi:hypothetical protein
MPAVHDLHCAVAPYNRAVPLAELVGFRFPRRLSLEAIVQRSELSSYASP